MASSNTKRTGAPVETASAGKAAKAEASSASAKAKSSDKSSAPAKKAKDAKDAKSKKSGKPGVVTRVATYFKNVRTEVRRVVWPTKQELVKYSVAVVAMLVFFGVLIAVVDALVLPALYAFSGLR